MPYIPIALDVALADTSTHTVNGEEVTVKTYAKEYRHQYSVIRLLLGWDTTYTRRYMKAIANKKYNCEEDPDEVSFEEQREQLLEKVRQGEDGREALIDSVMA